MNTPKFLVQRTVIVIAALLSTVAPSNTSLVAAKEMSAPIDPNKLPETISQWWLESLGYECEVVSLANVRCVGPGGSVYTCSKGVCIRGDINGASAPKRPKIPGNGQVTQPGSPSKVKR